MALPQNIVILLVSNIFFISNADYNPVQLSKLCNQKPSANLILNFTNPTAVVEGKVNNNCSFIIEKSKVDGLFLVINSLTNTEGKSLFYGAKCNMSKPFVRFQSSSWCSVGNETAFNKFAVPFKNKNINISITLDKQFIDLSILITAYKNKTFNDQPNNCPNTSTYDSVCPGKCENNEFSCRSRCIPEFLRCDGVDNCGDGADEDDCSSGFSAGGVILILLLVIISVALILIIIKYYQRNYL